MEKCSIKFNCFIVNGFSCRFTTFVHLARSPYSLPEVPLCERFERCVEKWINRSIGDNLIIYLPTPHDATPSPRDKEMYILYILIWRSRQYFSLSRWIFFGILLLFHHLLLIQQRWHIINIYCFIRGVQSVDQSYMTEVYKGLLHRIPIEYCMTGKWQIDVRGRIILQWTPTISYWSGLDVNLECHRW